MDIDARLESGPLSPDRELGSFLDALCGEGAVVSFVGVARPTSRAGARVTGLYLDHHPGVTAKSIVRIAEGASRRFGSARIRIVHRIGQVTAGEPIVFVAAASPHRRKAFEAADYVMDHLKSEAAFWKREDHANGSSWVEPTDQDLADLGRWKG